MDEDDGLGFTAGLVEVIERLIAAMAALLLADASLARLCALVFTLDVVVVTGFGGVWVVVVLQV